MDQTVKFYNLVDNNSFKSMDLGNQITCIEIAVNNKGKRILIVGFINGDVKLYELSNYQKIGKLIIHRGASITNIVSIKNNINDVVVSYLLITDSKGKCSLWCFQQAIHH